MHDGCTFYACTPRNAPPHHHGSPIGRQEDLVRLLGKAGYPATQSSVSRDLRELGVAKRGDRYVLPDESAPVLDDFATLARFVRNIRDRRHRPRRDPHDRGRRAVRRHRARSRRLARDRRHAFRRRHDLRRDDEMPPAQRRLLVRLHDKLRARGAHGGIHGGRRRAHPPRVLRRPRHVLLRALAHGDPQRVPSSRSPSTRAASPTRRPPHSRCAPSRSGPSRTISWMRGGDTSSAC